MKPAIARALRWLWALALFAAYTAPVLAHCDTLNGPVVATARTALESGKVEPALVWVRADDEAEIRRAFARALAVRKAGGEAKELADLYFFETLVRVHRAGEGAPYAGLKPAGAPEPAVAAAEQSIASGKLAPVAKAVTQRIESGLHRHFDALMAKKKQRDKDVEAGRAYASAYVEYVHYVERLFDAAETLSPGQPVPLPHGH